MYPGQICQMVLNRTTFSNTTLNQYCNKPIDSSTNHNQNFPGDPIRCKQFRFHTPGVIKIFEFCVVVSGRSWWWCVCVCVCVSVQVLLRRWGFTLFHLIHFIDSVWFCILIFCFVFVLLFALFSYLFLHLHLLLHLFLRVF